MPVQPTSLSIIADGRLRVAWSDGAVRLYPVRELRENCPCATCRGTHGKPATPPSLLPVLTAAEARPLTLEGMKPVGHYAYAIHFSDGHDTGIYTFDLLRELGSEAQ